MIILKIYVQSLRLSITEDYIGSTSPSQISPSRLSTSSQSQYAANYISSSSRGLSSSDSKEMFVSIRFEGRRASSSKHKFTAAAATNGSKPSIVDISIDESLSLLGEINENSEVISEIYIKVGGSNDLLLVAMALVPLSALSSKSKKPSTAQNAINFSIEKDFINYLASAQAVFAISSSEVASDRLPRELSQPVNLPKVPAGVDSKVCFVAR
jgi:hypothetical protein